MKFDNMDEVMDDLILLAWEIGEGTRESGMIHETIQYINYLQDKLCEKQEQLNKLKESEE